MMKPRLGVNIDHVRTLERQRLVGYPDLGRAAEVCLENGADQITIHLREDKRHIQLGDPEIIKAICKRFNKPLNFEMGTAREIIEIAKRLKPEWVCLVPEKREERTTEGGLALSNKQVLEKTRAAMEEIKNSSPETKISLFLEANPETIEKGIDLKVEAVEIHTGDFANYYLENNESEVHSSLEKFKKASDLLKSGGVACHAGHGITEKSLKPLLDLKIFEEYNIGHWIIAEAVFDGLGNVVRSLKKQISGS